MTEIVWNVIKVKSDGTEEIVGEHRFDVYMASWCIRDIERNRPELMEKIYGHGMRVEVKTWR